MIFGTFAVPYFLVTSLFFVFIKLEGANNGLWSVLRCQRILFPYIAWTLIYVVMRLVKYCVTGGSLGEDYLNILLFGASGVQMYYLPLLFLFQVLIVSFYVILKTAHEQATRACLTIVAATLFGLYGMRSGALGFKFALPCAVIYASFAFIIYRMPAGSFTGKVNLLFSILVFPGLVGFYLYQHLGGIELRPGFIVFENLVQGPLIGYALCVISMRVKISFSNRFILLCLGSSYGIYLAHFAFLETLEFVPPKLGFDMTPYSIMGKLLLTFIIIVLCVGLVWGARKNQWLALWLLGEEQKVVSTPPATSLPTSSKLTTLA